MPCSDIFMENENKHGSKIYVCREYEKVLTPKYQITIKY
jgi:hypothetical protein